MTREEALKKIEKLEGLNIKDQNFNFDIEMIPKGDVLEFIEKIDEPEKPVVPQFVADWYEEHKDEFYLNLHRVVRDFFEHLNDYYFNENPIDYDFCCWYYNNKNALQILVNMHQFGYEVEGEKKYTVRIKGIAGSGQYLNKNLQNKNWFIGLAKTMVGYTFEHTRKELEESGFGWVFDCEGIEVEEVE